MVDGRRLSGLAIVLAAIAAGPFWFRHRDPVDQLVRDASRYRRAIEPRLSGGFTWAPLSVPETPANPTLSSLASVPRGVAEVLSLTSEDQSVEGRHAAALALLIEQRPRRARAILEELAASAGATPEVWNDLAAARCVVARTENDPTLLAECLAAADQALRLDDRLYEARFNHALVLEQLGLRDLAREAWLAYARDEPNREWADEARKRAAALAPIPVFQEALEKKWNVLAADPEAARALARDNPVEARRWGETRVLQWWAEAARAHDEARAAECLRVASAFGSALRDPTLSAAVAAIGRAGDKLPHLVEAHILFAAGQQKMGKYAAAESRRLLIGAADEFERGGSPLSFPSKFFAAQTYHYLGDLPEARRRQFEILAAIPHDLPAHRAELLLQLGLGYQSDGNWGKAMEMLTESATLFGSIGEDDYVAAVQGLIAEIYDRTGDSASAWKVRMVALRRAGRQIVPRQQQVLDSMARAAVMRGQWDVASSFVDLSRIVAGRIDRPLVEIEAHLLRAQVSAKQGRDDDAVDAVRAARAVIPRITDAAVADGASADIMAIEAIIAPVPQRAIQLLDDAIGYQQTRGRKIRMPEMLLRRGRAFEKIGDLDRAAADYEAGIEEIEQQRKSLPSGAPRWGILNAAEELTEGAIGLAVKRGEVARAFAYVERTRSRELYEALRMTAPAGTPRRPIPRNVVVVEYAALPDKLLTFVLTPEKISMTAQALERELIERTAGEVRNDTESDRARGRAPARLLHQWLVEPIAPALRGAEAVVIVPGPQLMTVPFAALEAADGTYLVQRQAVTIAPSAAVFAQLAARPLRTGRDSRLLVIANPDSGENLPALPASEHEVVALQGVYDSVTSYTGAAATPAVFREEAANAAIVYLATHGVPGSSGSEAALILTGGRLSVTDIAATRLPRTAVVVAAACNTADGARRAEGTISVARAFLEAGAPSVISTLWAIGDDGAAGFFPLLHVELARGVPPVHALRTAQLEAIRRGIPPSIWAAAECMGSGGIAEKVDARERGQL
jgi:CHAT domain-containing protein/tetratricopeptide (TPR) repeat protein